MYASILASTWRQARIPAKARATGPPAAEARATEAPASKAPRSGVAASRRRRRRQRPCRWRLRAWRASRSDRLLQLLDSVALVTHGARGDVGSPSALTEVDPHVVAQALFLLTAHYVEEAQGGRAAPEGAEGEEEGRDAAGASGGTAPLGRVANALSANTTAAAEALRQGVPLAFARLARVALGQAFDESKTARKREREGERGWNWRRSRWRGRRRRHAS